MMALPFSSLNDTVAKTLVNISKMRDNEVGDGMPSVCVLVVELLR